MIYILLITAMVFSSEKSAYLEQNSTIHDIGDYPYPNNPMDDRAKGLLLSGKAKTAVANYGIHTGWDIDLPGLWGEFTYLPHLGLMAGVRGHKYSSEFIWNEINIDSEAPVWCSEDLYNAWNLDEEALEGGPYQRVNGNFIGIVFNVEDDRGDISVRQLSPDNLLPSEWVLDTEDNLVCISSFLNPNQSDSDIGVMYPWAMRPSLVERLDEYDLYNYGEDGAEYTDDDVYSFYGATVSESWFSRWDPKVNSDWHASTGSALNSHNLAVSYGDVFGYTPFVSSNNDWPVLSHSAYEETWPYDDYEGTYWPGWLNINDTFTTDNDVYMIYDDRWAQRGNMVSDNNDYSQQYLQTGYPLGLQVTSQIYSYSVPFFEDILIFESKISNQSHDLVMPDGTKLVSGEGFNYKDLSLGLFFDPDVVTTDMYGNSNVHTNDDDIMEYIDCRTSLEYYPNGCPVIDGAELRISMSVVGDWDGFSAGLQGYSMRDNTNYGSDFGLVALQLLDTPIATESIDLDGDGFIDIYPGEALQMTDWHWFDWYNRPGVVYSEGASGCCAGDPGADQAPNKEEIMYKIMVGDTTNLSENENSWYFHADPDLDQLDPNFNPHFDSIDDILETEYFQNGPEGLDAVMIISSGTFSLEVGDTTTLTYALVFGQNHEDLLVNAEMTQILYMNNYMTYSAPSTPNVSITEDTHSLEVNWDNVSESSIDNYLGQQDFEGYRVYKSLDGGETWGDEDDMIYDDLGAHVGWAPFAQFDYTLEEDMEYYNQEVNGPDPVYPWFYLGDDSGLQYNIIDEDVVPYQEYCYAVTAYDTGVLSESNGNFPFTPGSIESTLSNFVCGSPTGLELPDEDISMDSEENIGWSSLDYYLYNESFLNKSFHVEVDAQVDEGSWLNSPVENPLLYAFEIDSLDNPLYVSELTGSIELMDSISGLPGVEIVSDATSDDEFTYTMPDYLLVEQLGVWMEMEGLYLNIAGLDDSFFWDHVSGMPPQDVIWSNQAIESNGDEIEFELMYQNMGASLGNKPYFDYEITFGEVGIDTAYQVSPSSSCDDTNTLLPFIIVNTITGNKVNLVHYDKGVDGEGSSSNPIGGYADCQWSRREPVVFKETGVDLDDLDDEEWTYDLRIDWSVIDPEIDDYICPWIDQNIIGESAVIVTPKLLHDNDFWIFDAGGSVNLSNEVSSNNLPTTFILGHPYPNPFNPRTTINFSVPRASDVSINIYDINGRKIQQLENKYFAPGLYSTNWNASKVSSGVYFVRMNADGISMTRKLMLIK